MSEGVEKVTLVAVCQACREEVGLLHDEEGRALGWLHAHGELHCRGGRRHTHAFMAKPPGVSEREYKRLWMRRRRLVDATSRV